MKSPESRRSFIRRAALGLAALGTAPGICCGGREQTSPRSRPPNIIYILADDLGWGDLGCYGAEKIPTPNLDRLASRGVRFTDAHTPSGVCSPTRYGVLTGRYNWRSPLKHRVLRPWDLPLIEPGRTTVPKLLGRRGYKTAMFGKWHLGWQWPVKDGFPEDWANWDIGQNTGGQGIDLGGRITGGPEGAGFDHHFGVDLPNSPPYCFIENGSVVGSVPGVPKPDSMYGSPGPMQEGWDLRKVLPEITDRAVSWIGRRAVDSTRKPFFVYFALTAPHLPLVPDTPFLGSSEAGLYGDFVVQVDHIVGRIVQAVEEGGLGGETIIIFTSDNGSPARTRDNRRGEEAYAAGVGEIIEQFGHYPNGPFRGYKGDIWEGGHRVPLIVSWPGTLPEGVENSRLVCLTDLMATCAELTGDPLRPGEGEDSRSMLASLRDPSVPVREAVVHHSADGLFAVRRGDWKLILGKGSGSQYSSTADPEGENTLYEGQLYNLSEDPGERNNLYAELPDKVEELGGLLDSIRRGAR